MKINIIRGQNQIGGSIIEISSDTTKLIFEAGHEIDVEDQIVPDIDGLFLGEASYDGVFITHYHKDHIGLLSNILPGIDIYMGEGCYKVHKFISEWCNLPILEEPNFIYDSKQITIGDIKVTPFFCDHSAYDSYMYLIENNEKKVLYTGDFRSNGRKNFSSLLNKLPKVDALIIEGTVLERDDALYVSEEDLENIATKAMKGHNPVFFLQAATHVDRIVTNYKASTRNGKLFLQDLYMAGITSAIGGNIPNPRTFENVRVFLTIGGDEDHETLCSYGDKKIGKYGIAKSDFAMCIRSSMRNYLEKLSELIPFDNGILFYSMWSGYKEEKGMAEFLEFMESKGVKIHDLHTTGHADTKTIDDIIAKVSPDLLIPIHTTNPCWFEKYKDINILIQDNIIEI